MLCSISELAIKMVRLEHAILSFALHDCPFLSDFPHVSFTKCFNYFQDEYCIFLRNS